VRISLKTKLVVAFAVVTLIPSVTAAVVAIQLLSTRIVQEVQEKVTYDLNTARIIYRHKLDYIGTVVSDAAIKSVTREALQSGDAAILDSRLERIRKERSLDTLGAVDASGVVIARSQNPSVRGDSLAADSIIGKCLGTKKAVVGTMIMDKDRLLSEGRRLAQQAYIRIIPTPHATPREDKTETSGMALEACAPVLGDREELLGVVYGAVLLNRNYEIVDEVKETAYKGLSYRGKEMGTATIFQGDLRISTNVHLSDGSRAIGTRVSEEVNQLVLREGGVWTGPAFVVSDWYLSAYEPIKDIGGKVIGMLYVGILQEKSSDLRRNTFLLVLATAIISVGIALTVGYLFAAKISRPVVNLALASRRLSRGDFSASVKKTSEDEIGELEVTFNKMANSIRERDEKLKEETSRKLIQTEKLAAIGRLAAGVAHQINNPLTSVLLRSEMLLRRAQDAGRKDDLEIVIKEANRCSQIVKGLLDFSRQTVSRMESSDLNTLVSEVVSLVKTQARVNSIGIEEKYAENLPSIVVDRAQLREVLLNISLNALDAMPDGGRLTMSTRMIDRGIPRACITIGDTGVGIPEENMSKLFDPFFTTKQKGMGTGLGLAVSYGIVQAHGGTIEVESTVGKGTVFRVFLPLAPRKSESGTGAVVAGEQEDGFR
jgi:two-component system NtrC family sensor kinase